MRLEAVWREFPWLLRGALVTLELTSLAVGFALLIGLGFAVIGYSRSRAIRSLVRAYVDLIRGTPLLVQLLVVFYTFPHFGLKLNGYQAAVLTLSLNSAAYVTEIFRGAFLSIPRGQIEASRAIGITSGQTMRRIIIPQLLGVVIPSLTNEFVKLLKGSSVVSILAVIELTRAAQQVIQTTFAAFEIYGAIAVLYFVMCASVQYLSHCVELRVTRYR